MENYSLSDIAALGSRCDDGFGGSSAWVLIILFALIFGWGGNGFGGGQAATGQDIQRAVDLNSIQEGQAGINGNVQRIGYETMGTVKDASYNNLSEIRDLQTQVNAGFANMQTCCCGLDKSIMENRYLDAQNTAAINANTTAAMQKVLDTIQADKIASLQSQVSDLKTQNMFCGIPKINPYGYGISPSWNVCGCGTGCGC